MPDLPDHTTLSDLPTDMLCDYARSIGLCVDDKTPRGELLRRVRAQQERLITIDRDALLDVVVWLRRPVRQSATKEELARAVVGHGRTHFDGLSQRGLVALANLAGLDVQPGEPRPSLEKRLARSIPWSDRARRARRSLAGSLVAKLLSSQGERSDDQYRFLPEDGKPSLKAEVKQNGLVSGVAKKLRGVADDYIAEKLDEIERRIDLKLDEIDRRLSEWRDREVSHRLRIIKITLIASILVAVLSLLYDSFRSSVSP